MSDKVIHKFVGDQLSRWPLACGNFRALKNVRVREVAVGGLEVKLQFNPARMISSAAKLTKADISQRRCFLCRENRPPEQIMMKFEGRKGKRYDILVNPYPIFPDHLVIAMSRHTDQSIWNRYVDMLDLARKYDGYTFFYNGPKSGASAPDHHHFQGSPRGLMPLENDVDRMFDNSPSGYVTSVQDAHLYHYGKFTKGIFVLRAETSKSAAKLLYRLLDCAEVPEGEPEPLINLFAWYAGGEYRSIIVFRRSHRSHHYWSDGPDHLTMSPGCADMAGVFIVPVEEEYEKITPQLLEEMVEEVSIPAEEEALIIRRLTRTQPLVEVGIMSGKELEFEILTDGAGRRKAKYREGKIEYDGALYDELYFEARTLSTYFAEPSFVLHGVTIGVDFHWQRKEDQMFAGALKIVTDRGRLTAVNVVGVEDYLLSVISSEMKSSASLEFLKAHAVISRSWVMARLSPSARRDADDVVPEYVRDLPSLVYDIDRRHSEGQDGIVHEHIKWYDHEDHHGFDICADDHCQRYQGLTRPTGRNVRKAIDQTWGQVLEYEGCLCDTRFSKCCGGLTEKFSTCWDDRDFGYLISVPDSHAHDPQGRCYCDTDDKAVLEQVLNPYDLETSDFFRWNVEYGRDELSELFARRTGYDLGRITALIPLERGGSGRIIRLKVIGEDGYVTIGKELEIRRALSPAHLKSSAFDVIYLSDSGQEVSAEDDWSRLRLDGRGWGHGVGLCQIGAAVMASEGHTYEELLTHYYPGAEICTREEETGKESDDE